MKISYRNQAVLKMLHTGSLGPVAINSQDKNELTDELLTEFGKLWKLNATSFNKSAKVLSLPFAEAVLQSANKLASGDLIDEAFLQNTSGTIIINDRTICYSFERINEKQAELTYFLFQKNTTDAPELRCFLYVNLTDKITVKNQPYTKSGITKTFSQLNCTKALVRHNFINSRHKIKILPLTRR